MKIETKKQNIRIEFLIGLLVGILVLNSCSDDNVLALEPFNQISEEAAFSTPELVELSVTGLYNAAQIGIYSGTFGRGYPFGAAFIQQGDNRGEDVVNVATFYQFTYTATYDPTTANNVFYWSDTYRLINRANIVLEGVETALSNDIISQEVANDYMGQAKFLRAAAHLELMWHFAKPYNDTPDASHLGVPYRDFAITTQESIDLALTLGRNTTAECYQKIIADFDDAEALLNSKAERGGILGLIRATKEAAIAYKTRAYQHMGDWQMVIAEANKLDGIYELTIAPNDVFENGYSNSESIFSIEHTAENNPGVNAALGSQYNRRGLVVISPIVWRNPLWLADDLRREEGALVTTRDGVKYTNKYKDDVNYTDPAPVIRYAEVLLNLAEAYARENDPNNALTYLNRVRNRSLVDPATQAYENGDFATQTELVNGIIDERRFEFVMEGRRWPDIHRLQNDDFVEIDGIPAKVANGTPPADAYTLGTPYDGPFGVNPVLYNDTEFLWPIPQQEINNNPTLAQQQNLGW